MTDTAPTRKRRSAAGRKARILERTSALADELKPVRPGIFGGRYKALDDSDIGDIKEAVNEVLERIGLAAPTPSVVEHCTRAGALLGDDGRLRFPNQTVRDALDMACRKVVLCARDPDQDLVLEGQRVHYGTGGAAVHIVDSRTGEYRDSVLRDIYDMARVVDCCEHIHFYYRTVVARDLPDMFELDVNTHYAALQGTTKHIGGSFSIPRSVTAVLEMAHEIAGGEEAWRERPFMSTNSCFVVPPLTYAEDACNCLELAVLGGMPVNLLSAGQAGATGPAALDRNRGAGNGRMSRGSGLCERPEAGRAGGPRHVALCFGSADRRHVRRIRRTGNIDERLCPGGEFLRDSGQRCRGDDGFKNAGHPVGL